MGYNISLDGGGTKVKAILFDDDGNFVSHAQAASVNLASAGKELAELHTKQCLDKLLEDKNIVQINKVYNVGVCNNLLEKNIKYKAIICSSESLYGLLCAGVQGKGVCALSGTGAAISYWNGENVSCVYGAYGSIIDDAGSGYYIGRRACRAAIRYCEGWGEKTILCDLIKEKMQKDNLKDALFKVYEIDGFSPISVVASMAPLVSIAADKGDSAALSILSYTGNSLGRQTTALIRKFRLPEEIPVAITGSVYKGHPIIFNTFKDVIRKSSLNRVIARPMFEPVMGGVLQHLQSKNGILTADDYDRLKEQYKEFKYIMQGE